MTNFHSLFLALEGWFDSKLADLPASLRQRVEGDLFPLPWDELTSNQRRTAAVQWDYENDPDTEEDREYWFDLAAKKLDLKKQIAVWEAATTSTTSDLVKKETRLQELRQSFARINHEQNRPLKNYYPKTNHGISKNEAKYIAYPKAAKLLTDRLKATPDEIAAWVLMGPEQGGLAAYLNANELNPPPRFYFGYSGDSDFDYVGPLMACWFCEADITDFQPAERYITGKALIERWKGEPGIQPEAFIRAKIAESRLLDAHPTFGCTQGSSPDDEFYPPLDCGLFVLSHVEEIEEEDFGIQQSTDNRRNSSPEVGTPEWRKQNATTAANTRHNQPGGSREKQQRMREIWATGKYTSRDRCAEEECAALDMSYSAARKALRNTPNP